MNLNTQKQEINVSSEDPNSRGATVRSKHLSKSKLKLISSKNKLTNIEFYSKKNNNNNTILSAIICSVVIHAAVISALLYVASVAPKSDDVIHMITFEAASGGNDSSQSAENKSTQISSSEVLIDKEIETEKVTKEPQEKQPEIIEKIKKVSAKPVKKVTTKSEVQKISNEPQTTQQGSQGTALSGTGQSADSTLTEGQSGNLKANASYDSMVLGRLIAAKRYPERARRRGLEGEIVLAFSINRDGTISNGTLFKQSDSEILNQEAIDMLNRAAPFPQPPSDYRPGRTIEYKVPIKFTLN